MIDILDRRAALRALHSYDFAAVEDIAIGISAAYIFLDACSVLIIISAESVVLAELYEQLNYTLSTRFCQIYYASYNISKEYY